MPGISNADLNAIDAVWRALPEGHPWCGWAYAASAGNDIWVFRERANWRRFTLQKSGDAWTLLDDALKPVRQVLSLSDVPDAVIAAPGLTPSD